MSKENNKYKSDPQDEKNRYRKVSKTLNKVNHLDALQKSTNRAAELHKSMLAMQSVIRDPLIDFQKSMLAMQSVVKDPLKDFQKSMLAMQSVIRDPLKDFQKSMLTIQSVIRDPLKDFHKSMLAMQSVIKDPLIDFHKSINIYKDIFQRSIPANNFEEAYTEVISRVVIAHSDDDISEALLKTAEEVKLETESATKSILSIQFYLNFIIAFIFFVYSMQFSHESEKRILDRINVVQEVVIEKLEEVIINKSDDVYYVVQRPVNLRTKPTTKKNNIINVLYPNQTTILIERKGKWIKVAYFNHLTGDHESGWCYKKYLKKIDNRH